MLHCTVETPKPKVSAPAPAKVAPVEQVKAPVEKDDMQAELDRQAKEIEELRKQLAEKEASSEPAPDEYGPTAEVVNIAGLVLEKTTHPDGGVHTEVLSEPMISMEEIRATRALQAAQGF